MGRPLDDDWPNCQHSQRIAAGGVRWHLQRMGTGPVLLLLHGAGASTHSFRALLPILARDFTVVAPDLPGHAFSEVSDGFRPSLPNVAKALGALLGALELTPVLGVGHSAGAAILCRMALDGHVQPRLLISINGALLPFRGLAGLFFSPAAKLMNRTSLAPRLFAWRARDVRMVRQLIEGTGSELDEAGIELYQRLLLRPEHVAAVLSMMAHWDLEPLERDLGRLAGSVLLLAGARDQAVPAAEARRAAVRLPGARVEELPGAGHLWHEEHPEAAGARIARAAAEVG